ncbi:MAG TPA: histidine kinase, partial [Acidimicrobiia bacterium]
MAARGTQSSAPVAGGAWCPTDNGRAPWLTPVREAVMLDIVDPPVLAQKAALALHDIVGMSFTGIAIREASGLFAMHGVSGGRHDETLRRIRVSPGQGLGGKVVSLRRPVTVTDYVRDPAITTHFRDLAIMEELGGMAAVPVLADGDVVAIVYSATRNVGSLGERVITVLDEAARGLADLFGVAVRHDDAVRQHAAAERQRIAEELHDSVGQLLFAIGTSARRLRPDAGGAPPSAQVGREIEGQAAEASSRLRHALGMLGPQTPEECLPVAVRIDVEAFSHRSGVPAHLVVMGQPRGIAPDETCALLNVVREALHNVAKHA